MKDCGGTKSCQLPPGSERLRRHLSGRQTVTERLRRDLSMAARQWKTAEAVRRHLSAVGDCGGTCLSMAASLDSSGRSRRHLSGSGRLRRHLWLRRHLSMAARQYETAAALVEDCGGTKCPFGRQQLFSGVSKKVGTQLELDAKTPNKHAIAIPKYHSRASFNWLEHSHRSRAGL